MLPELNTRWRLYSTLAGALAFALVVVALVGFFLIGLAGVAPDPDGALLARGDRLPFRW